MIDEKKIAEIARKKLANLPPNQPNQVFSAKAVLEAVYTIIAEIFEEAA